MAKGREIQHNKNRSIMTLEHAFALWTLKHALTSTHLSCYYVKHTEPISYRDSRDFLELAVKKKSDPAYIT